MNPIYKEKDVKDVVNLDLNSLYPYIMYDRLLPFDLPKEFEGEYKEDKIYCLYIQRILCSFEIKKNKIPTIQIKNNMSFIPNEYVESSNNELVMLTLTNVDLQLFKEHYKIYNEKYCGGWKFKGIRGIFTQYIDKWIEKKNEGTIKGNLGLRTLAKLMLNSLYGKLATALEVQSKIPYLEDDIVKYRLSEKEDKDGLYLPSASFITSYARELTIRTAQKIKEYSLDKYGKDMYIYSDTDSIKTLLPIDELEKFCNIDNVKLGAWKNEGIATKGKWIRQKCYLEEFYHFRKYYGKSIKLLRNLQKNCKKHHNIKSFNRFKDINITCAGMPKSCYSQVEWDKFKVGFSCKGKLTFKHVKGGIKLVETDFTIKELKFKKEIKNF